MFKNIRNKVAALIAAVSLVAVPLALPVATYAASPDINNSLCTGADLTTSTKTCAATTSSGTTKINSIITTVVNIFSIVVGVVAVIMIIIGGLRYITSGGDSNNVSAAKNTIIYAIIGLVVVALAQFIVKFVLNKVTQ
jgi:hypothetical protein